MNYGSHFKLVSPVGEDGLSWGKHCNDHYAEPTGLVGGKAAHRNVNVAALKKVMAP